MIYNDIVSLIGTVPEGYEWIYSVCAGGVIGMYVYTFLHILFGLFKTSSRGRY